MKSDKITKTEALARFCELREETDQEQAHAEADSILAMYLLGLGETEVAEAYLKARTEGKWQD